MAKVTYKVINVRMVPLGLYQKVKALAAKEGRTMNGIVCAALSEYVERHRKGGDR